MSLFLTGHVFFRTYVHKIGKVEDEKCMYYGEEDKPEHTINGL